MNNSFYFKKLVTFDSCIKSYLLNANPVTIISVCPFNMKVRFFICYNESHSSEFWRKQHACFQIIFKYWVSKISIWNNFR